jgi:flagellar L-ring protein FlgH
MSKVVVVLRRVAALVLVAGMGGCSAVDRLRSIGEPPPLTQIENPVTQPGYKPVQMPMPTPQPVSYNPNSLWRNGSRAFFKDQRAHQVGDIMTVKVKITDKANIENETQRSRSNKENSGVDDFIGSKLINNPAKSILPGASSPPIRPPRAKARVRCSARRRCRPMSPPW